MCVLIGLDANLGSPVPPSGLEQAKNAASIRSKQTLADQFPSYDLRESLEMWQHNNKALILDLWHLRGQIYYFLLLLDQFLILETKINI